MADIYAFPTGAPNEGHPERPQGVPDDVWAAVESVSAMKRLYDVRYREIPVPSTLADYGIGVELEAGERMDSHPFAADSVSEPHVATGWVMTLYSHELRPDWNSNWRCVAFARLPLEPSENDSLAPGMYWRSRTGLDFRNGHRHPEHHIRPDGRQHQRRLRDTCLMDAT